MNKLLTILLLLTLASCGKSSKHLTKEKSKLDSSAIIANDKVEVSKDFTIIQEDKNIEKVSNVRVSLIYDTGKVQINTVLIPTGKENKTAYDKIINALVNDRLRRVDIEGDFKLTDQTKTTTSTAKVDSTADKSKSNTHVVKEVEKKTVDKETSGLGITWQILLWLILAIIILLFIVFKRTWFVQLFIYIKNIMKKLLTLFIVSTILMFISCNNPDGKIYGTEKEPAGWVQGQQTFTEYVIIKPTWGQSFYFSFKDGYAVDLIIAIILFILGCWCAIVVSKKLAPTKILNTLSIAGIVIGIVGAFLLFFSTPERIHSDNSIKVEKKVYDFYKDDFPALWDGMYAQKRIIGTSGN